MKVLIVYAHHEPKSFNGALRDTAVAVLTAAGHEVAVSDLHAMNFNPVAGPGDFTGPLANPDHGTLAADIVAEQEKLRWADAVILQFPLY